MNTLASGTLNGGSTLRSTTRYGGFKADGVVIAEGWSCKEVRPPSRLVGANGLIFGPDGDLYVAQGFGSEISAVDTQTGAVRSVSRTDNPILNPDDLAFDTRGTMYVTEFLNAGRVSMRHADGTVRVLDPNVASANGVATHGDRVFVDEFRPGGRIMELFPDGRERRVIADGVDWPNGMAVAPNGDLYYPSVFAGEIWRVAIDGGEPQRVVSGLAMPTAVKFSPNGELHTTLAGGEVLRVEERTGAVKRIATVPAGVDNFAFRDDGRIFVSNQFDGSILGVSDAGALEPLLAPGFVGPFGLDVARDGTICVADAWSCALVTGPGRIERPLHMSTPDFPGVVRSIVALADGRLVFGTTAGDVAVYAPGTDSEMLASSIPGLMGMALDTQGGILAAASSSGEVLRVTPGEVIPIVADLEHPIGVTATADGGIVVGEAAAGRVRAVAPDGTTRMLLGGLTEPHGVAASGDEVYVLDRGAQELLQISLSGRVAPTVVASGLPVGPARGVTETVLPGLEGLVPGPWRRFADLAIASDGAVIVGCDGAGSILSLRRDVSRESGRS